MSKKMKRSPFLVGSSGSGIPSPDTFLKYLGLRREDERREISGPAEEHFDRSQAAPACITSGKGPSVRFSTMGLISTRMGWGLVQTACSLDNPFTLSL